VLAVDSVDSEEVSFVAKKKKAPRRKRDWRIIVFLILSIIIALTMILAFLPGLLNVPTN
jgi:predicted nucleic acid-binding Zn ribbon protein